VRIIARSVAAFPSALEAAGVEATNGDQPGVRMKPPAKPAIPWKAKAENPLFSPLRRAKPE
jgi:hypothetical protein